MMAEPGGPVDFWLSGQLRIRQRDEVRTLGPTLLHEILAMLLLHANSAVPVTDIARSVWPTPGQAGEEAVRPYISRIRRLLTGVECELTTLPRRYILEVDPMRVDVLRFNLLVERADRGDVADRRRLLEAAMEGCPTDTLLGGFTRGWVRMARDEHRARWRAAALRRNRYWLEDGEHERLLDALRREHVHQSTDQRLAQDYLLALYRSGQVAEALAHYRQLVTHLTGARATIHKRLRSLGEQIARQDPVLDLVSPHPVSGAPDMLPPPTGWLEGRAVSMREIDSNAGGWAGEEGRYCFTADRESVRVVGIYGAPGIGKTSLATEYAHRNKHRYPGGVLFAQLPAPGVSGGADIDAVLESFLRALGVGPDNIPAERSARVVRYRDLVRRRAMLVVLDNVEASDDAVPLLPTGPGSLAIVTSRNRLTKLTSHYGARAVVLGPIDDAASVALLTHLAGGRADWNPSLVADIGQACGGHPLALCLAGARLATRPEEPLRAVAAALSEPGRRIPTLDEHAEANAAVTEVIGWSYHVLDDPVARVFRLLGVAPCATLDLASVARLADGSEGEVRNLVDRLVALHLVTSPLPDRYGMLDLVAEYAGTLAAQIDGDDMRAAALDRLYDHHRAAARAAAHAMWPLEVPAGPPGYDVGGPAAARAWLDSHREDLLVAARHPAARSRPEHVVDLANSLFRYLDHGGYLDQAVALQDEAATAAGRTGDETGQAWALARLGAVLVRRGPADQAESVLHRAYDLGVRIADPRVQAVALGNLGRIAYRRGAYGDALAQQKEALNLFRSCGDRLAEARTLTNIGLVDNARGAFDEALGHLETARAICDQLMATDAAARVTGTIAGVLRAQGRLDEAEAQYQQTIRAFHDLGDRVGEATSLSRLGLVRSDLGRHPEAIELLEAALTIFTEVADEAGSIDTLINLGAALRATGRHVAAVRSHREALDRAGRVGSEGQAARAHACLAEDYAAQAAQTGAEAVDALALASKHLDEALGRYHQLGIDAPPGVLSLSERLSRV